MHAQGQRLIAASVPAGASPRSDELLRSDLEAGLGARLSAGHNAVPLRSAGSGGATGTGAGGQERLHWGQHRCRVPSCHLLQSWSRDGSLPSGRPRAMRGASGQCCGCNAVSCTTRLAQHLSC